MFLPPNPAVGPLLSGFAPNFDYIRTAMLQDISSHLTAHPEQTFMIKLNTPDVFSLRKESMCAMLAVLDLSDNDFRAQGCLDLQQVCVCVCTV